MTRTPGFRTARPLLLAGVLVAVLVTCATCATVVWPTRYRDLPLEGRPRGILAARIDRFTGAVDWLMVDGWHRARLAPSVPAARGSRFDSLWNAADTARGAGRIYSPDNPFAPGHAGPR